MDALTVRQNSLTRAGFHPLGTPTLLTLCLENRNCVVATLPQYR